MANSLLARATQALKSKMEAGKRLRERHKKEEEVIITSVGTLAGSGAAGLVDTKLSKTTGQPHKLFAKSDGTGGFPTNIAVGAVIGVAAVMVPKLPMKSAIAGFGMSMAGAGLYRYIVDHAAANPSQ